MEKNIGTKSARGLVRAAAVAVTVSIGLSGLGLLGVSVLAITGAAPARASCELNGRIDNQIASGGDCLEAQRTGCVRHMLTPEGYKNCLQNNARANARGQTCILGGQIHNEYSAEDCEEAKATGCVRRFLTPAQYNNCLNAQRH